MDDKHTMRIGQSDLTLNARLAHIDRRFAFSKESNFRSYQCRTCSELENKDAP